MVSVEFTSEFQKLFSKIKDSSLKERVSKQIMKLEANPEAGKPMRYDRRGTREMYIPPFRLTYAYVKDENKIILLDLYHKDEQ